MFVAKRSVIIVMYGLAAVPLTLIGGAGAWLFNDISGTAKKYDDVVLDAGGAQIPLEPGSFVRIELPRADQDAGPLLADLNKRWTEIPDDTQRKLLMDFGASGKITPRAESIQSIQPLVNLLNAAGSRRDSALKRDWSDTDSKIEPFQRSLTDFSRLAACYAVYQAQNGNPKEAFRILHAIRRVGKHISRDSGLDGMALHIVLETTALEAAIRVGRMNPSALAELSAFVRDRSTEPDLIRNMEGEAMRSIYVLSEPESYKDQMFSGAKLSMRNETFQRAATVRMVEFWCQAITAVRPVAESPYQARQQFVQQAALFGRDCTPSRLIAATVADWNIAKLNLYATLDIRYQLAEGAIPLLKAQMQQGKLPENPECRVLDPYGDGNLKVGSAPGGFVIYSVGTNRTDDFDSESGPSAKDISLIVQAQSVYFKGL